MKFLLVCGLFFFSACSFLPQPVENPLPLEVSTSQSSEFSDEQIAFLEDEQLESDESQTYRISRIIDGDTLYIIVNGQEEKIRIMGIDTPEKTGGFRTAECFGDDASEYAKEYLSGKRVALLESKTGDTEDQYGRWLRYVFVDGEDFGAHLITQGLAESYRKFPHDRRSYYNDLEKKAQNEEVGMWSEESCLFWGQEG